MDDVITIATNLSTKGFEKGTKAMQRAITSLSRSVQQMGKVTAKGATTAFNSMKRLLPMIVGVGSAYGILSKAVSAFMAQNEQLSQKLSAVWTALGNVLGPIITQIINWVTTAVSYFLEFLRLLGITGKKASELSKKASGSAGQLQKTIAGFDELNVLNDNSGGGGATLEDIEPSEWMKKLADLLKNKMWDEAADIIIKKMNHLIDVFKEKATEFGDAAREYFQGIVHVIARVLDEVNWKGVGEGIANFFNALLKEVEGLNLGEDLGKILAAKITIPIKALFGFLETIDFARIGNIVSEAIKSFFDSINRALQQGDFEKIGKNIADFFNNIDWDGIGKSLFNLLGEAWKSAIELLTSFLTTLDAASIGEGIRHFFQDIDWEKLANDLYNILKLAWEKAWELLLALLGKGEANEPPIIKSLENIKTACEELADTLTSILGPAWDDILKPLLEWSGETVLPAMFQDIAKIISDATDALKLFMDIIEGVARILNGDFAGGFSLIKDGFLNFTASVSESKSGLDLFLEKIGLIKPKNEEAETSADSAAGAIEREGNQAEETAKKFEHSKTSHQEAAQAVADYHAQVESGNPIMDDAVEAQREYAEKLSEEKQIIGDIASEMGNATEEVAKQADKNIELAGATSDAARAGTDLVNANKDIPGATQQAEQGLDNVKTSAEEAEQSYTENAGEMADTTAEKWEEIKTKSEELSDSLNDTFNKISDNISKTMSDISSKIKTNFEKITSEIRSKTKQIENTVSTSFQNMANRATSQVSSMSSRVSSGLSRLSSSAYRWGADMASSFANGIYSRIGSIVSAASSAASAVRSYLGFSEPEKGPLSDFHTYGPDMMNLYAEGITKSKGVVEDAVSSVAEGVVSSLSSDDFSIGTNLSLFGNISSESLKSSPVVSGEFLPHGIGTSSATQVGIDSLAGITTQIYSAVYDAMTNAISSGSFDRGETVINVNGREFCRATYNDQQAVAREHGISLIANA